MIILGYLGVYDVPTYPKNGESNKEEDWKLGLVGGGRGLILKSFSMLGQ